MASAVSVSGEEDREQIQCGDTETTDHEQGQQSPYLALQTYKAREGQGIIFNMFWFPFIYVCFILVNRLVGVIQQWITLCSLYMNNMLERQFSDNVSKMLKCPKKL